MHRRHLLAAVAGIAGSSGCLGVSSTDSDGTPESQETPTETPRATDTSTETPTPTESPNSTPTPVSESDFELVTEVVRQPSTDDPGRIRAILTNRSSGTVELAGGDPLPVGQNLNAAEQVDASSPLLLFPDGSDALNEYTGAESGERLTINDAYTNDCWRMSEEVVSTSAGTRLELGSNASIVADYYPLGYPDADCPRGTYEASDEIAITGNLVGAVYTTLEVTVNVSGSLSVTGDLGVSAL